MSNIYIQEPPSDGKVLLETTVGDIDIELWSREAPKACRNFIQLCMEGYYNRSPFHRLVKGFIVQGGDPTGTGTGGTSIWGKPFKDEIHSRLRFVRRGLVAMANGGRDDNASQFFFTLGPTPELQNKHTIFGKVAGDTIYNMIKLEEGEVDHDERPLYPHKILRTKVLNNPFSDIVPRQSVQSLSKLDRKAKKSSAVATKNFNLLSFGEEAEEEEEEIGVVNRQFIGKGKSSHDLTDDPKLSSEPTLIKQSSESSPRKSSESNDDHDHEDDSTNVYREPLIVPDQLSSIKEKLSKKKSGSSSDSKKKKKDSIGSKNHESDEEEYYLGKEEKLADKKRLEEIQKEFRQLKKSMRKEKETLDEDKALAQKETAEKEAQLAVDNSVIQDFMDQQKLYKEKKSEVKKGDEREAQTLILLQKFKSKITTAIETCQDVEEVQIKEDKKEVEDDPSDISWLAKSLHKDQEEIVLAKDANKKSDDWYEIYDPKNPLNRRRREESKKNEGERWKRFKPID